MPRFDHMLHDTRERRLDPSTHLLDKRQRRNDRVRVYATALSFAVCALITVGIVAVVSP